MVFAFNMVRLSEKERERENEKYIHTFTPRNCFQKVLRLSDMKLNSQNLTVEKVIGKVISLFSGQADLRLAA